MKKNIRILIRFVIILISILIAVIYFQSKYSVNEENLEIKLSEYINEEEVNIISKEEIEGLDDEYFIVHYKFENMNGIAFLNKGINNKYQIRNTDYTDNELAFVEYSIEGERYFAAYGMSNEEISRLNINFSSTSQISESINDKTFLILIKGPLEIEYVNYYEMVFSDGRSETTMTNGMSLNKDYRSSGPKGIVYFTSVMIIFLSYILTTPIYNKFKRFEGQVEDQRIKELHKMY